MDLLFYAMYFAALAVSTVLGTVLMNSRMDKRGFKFRKHITVLIMLLTAALLYLIGGFSLWTVKGTIMAFILLYASVQDLSTREADDCLWVMLCILSLVNLRDVSIGSMLLGAAFVFVPQLIVAMFAKTGGIGGADIKLSTAAALSLGFLRGAVGYMVGLIFAVVFQTVYNKIKGKSNKEAFPLLPFLSVGLMIGYLI